MNLFTAFICYAVAALICVALPILIAVFAGKKGYKLKGLHLFFGIVFFVIFFVGYYLVLKYHLTAADGIAEYYNTATYRVVIIALLTAFASTLLWLFGMIVYMKRQSYKACLSFFAGFGCGGCILVGGYALLMFVMLTIQCLRSSLICFDTTVQAFYFSDETYFSVFLPMSGHISFAIAAFCFLIVSLTFALIMSRITSAHVPMWTSTLSFIGLIISLSVFLVVLCFMSMFEWPHYVMAALSMLCAGICVGMTSLTYRFVKIPESAYQKQFE